MAVRPRALADPGAPVLREVSLELSLGEKIIIVGPNGCGKTTLANILAGYLTPSKGDLTLPEKISAVTLPISFPPLKVKELVNDTELLIALNLADQQILEAYAEDLSIGQQQKIALSLALSQDADLYVIDEPLASLDQESRDTAINLILQKTKGKSLIVIMHGAEEYYHLFDRVLRIGLHAADAESGTIEGGRPVPSICA